MSMDNDAKVKFVRDVCNAIARGIVDDIEAGKVPGEWEGIELRWLIQDHAESAFGRDDKKRVKSFKNIVLVNNL